MLFVLHTGCYLYCIHSSVVHSTRLSIVCIAQLSFVCASHLIDCFSHALVGTVRFVSYDDLHWFDRTVARVVGEELSDDLMETVQHSANFVDFMRYHNSDNIYFV